MMNIMKQIGKIRQAKNTECSLLKRLQYIVVCLLLTVVMTPVQAETYYFHNDHLGTPQVVTDSDQQVVWKGEYDPFGKVTETVSEVEQNLRFPGQYYDEETGLHYNGMRYYNPSDGRYITSDPIGLVAGLSTFSYVAGNPISFFDLLGLEIIGEWIKYPNWSNIEADLTGISVWAGVGVLELARVSFDASADLHFLIGCTDTCSGENWEIDSGNRKLNYSGSLPVPAPPPGVSCLANPRNSWQTLICQTVNYAKYSEWAKKAGSVFIDEEIRKYFDTAVKTIEAAIDPTNWCKLLPKG